MALTEIPIELSSTPSIVDGGNATAITIDSSENVTLAGNILHAGNLTLDVASSITLDSDSGVIDFDDGGVNIGRIENSSSDFKFESRVQDKDILFVGNDGGSGITALTLDMSAAGAATLNNGLTLTDGNVVVANGHGIDFGATGNISGTSSELLSDYEEGTFTLTWTGSGGTANSTNTQFKYIKVGSLVTIFGNTASTLPNATGTLTLTGLPFVNRIETAGSVLYRRLTPPTGAHTLVAYIGTNVSTVSPIWSSAVNYTALTSSHFNSDNQQDMYFSISYRTD